MRKMLSLSQYVVVSHLLVITLSNALLGYFTWQKLAVFRWALLYIGAAFTINCVFGGVVKIVIGESINYEYARSVIFLILAGYVVLLVLVYVMFWLPMHHYSNLLTPADQNDSRGMQLITTAVLGVIASISAYTPWIG